MTRRKREVFYSSNKPITLDEVIFSSYIRKIESQLSWSGSSLGHKKRAETFILYQKKKKKKEKTSFKDAMFALCTWALSTGTTSDVTDHIFGAGEYCFSFFWGAP